MSTKSINFGVRKHKQPGKKSNEILGQKYAFVIECDGHVFYEMTRFGTDEQIEKDLLKLTESIRSAKISVKK